MSFEEDIVTIHVYQVLSLLDENMGQLIKANLFVDFDIEKFIYSNELKLTFKFVNEFILFLHEEYEVKDYELQIVKYHYSYLAPDQTLIFSCDNRPHHTGISTFPHHKHYHSKDKYNLASFSGKLIDFLQEVKWLIERSL